MSAIAVGVDAGGTSTVAVVEANGERREERGPAGNPTTLGIDDAADAILRTVRGALDGAQPAAICVGAAGAGRSEVANELRELIAVAFPRANVVVGNDAAIALRAAIPEGPGAVLVAGTGSIAYAENGERRALIGGLGYLLGDEGSGYAIGLAAVKLLGRVYDGRERRDETSDLVARALDAPDRDALLRATYDAPIVPSRIAALAPSIIAFAGKGNRASTKIVQTAAGELADLVKHAIRGAGLFDASPAVALAGGLFAENSLLTFLVESRIGGDVAGATVVRGGDPPVEGALRIARALAGA